MSPQALSLELFCSLAMSLACACLVCFCLRSSVVWVLVVCACLSVFVCRCVPLSGWAVLSFSRGRAQRARRAQRAVRAKRFMRAEDGLPLRLCSSLSACVCLSLSVGASEARQDSGGLFYTLGVSAAPCFCFCTSASAFVCLSLVVGASGLRKVWWKTLPRAWKVAQAQTRFPFLIKAGFGHRLLSRTRVQRLGNNGAHFGAIFWPSGRVIVDHFGTSFGCPLFDFAGQAF